MVVKCMPLTSNCLQACISISCLFTFISATLSGLFLVIAPEEYSRTLGGGALYTLVPGIVLLVVAVATIPQGVFGCFSVATDSWKRLLAYSLIAVLLSVVTLSSATVLFSFTYTDVIKNDLNSSLWLDLNASLPNSSNTTLPLHLNADCNNPICEIQKDYKCCGVSNGSDWLNPETQWYKYFEDRNESVSFPTSCFRPNISYTSTGCRDKLHSRLEIVVDASFGVAVLASILQILTGSLTCYGNRLIKRYEDYDVI